MTVKPMIRTLVLTDRSDSVSRLQHIFFTEKRYSVRFTNTCQEALQSTAQDTPDVILVDDSVRDGETVEAIRKLSIVAPLVPIVALADEKAVAYVRDAMLAGARAFILKPINEAEVFSTLSQLVEMETLRHDSLRAQKPTDIRHNQIITLISPKGGVGCTMLAVNLALLLRQQTGAKVALIDGHSSLGDLETVLNLTAQFTCADVLAQGASMDLDLLKGMMVAHKSGIHVLVSSRSVEASAVMTADGFEKLLSLLAAEYEYVIVDGGATAEEQTAVVLSLADRVLLVATPEMSALQRTSLFLKAADENDFPREKLFLVVNRAGVKGGVPVDEIGRHLNMQIMGAIPEDTGLVTYSLNRGIPLVQSDPRSAVARQVEKLAKTLIPEPKSAPSRAPKGLFGRLSTILQNGAA